MEKELEARRQAVMDSIKQRIALDIGNLENHISYDLEENPEQVFEDLGKIVRLIIRHQLMQPAERELLQDFLDKPDIERAKQASKLIYNNFKIRV